MFSVTSAGDLNLLFINVNKFTLTKPSAELIKKARALITLLHSGEK